MKRKNTFTLVYFFFLGLFIANAQQQLGYTLKPGQSFLVKQVANQEMVMKMDGTQQVLNNEMDALFSFTVQDEVEEGYALEFEFKDFAMKSSTNLQGTLIDVRASEPQEGNLMSTIFSGLLGTKLNITMKKTGEILSVTGADKLVGQMLGAAGDLDEFTKNLMQKSLEKEFSSESLSNSFEQMTFMYSDQPVSDESTWETIFEGKINAQNKWTLEKVDGDTVSLSGNSAITMNTQESSLSMDLSGSQEIIVQASKATGFINKMMVNANGEGASKMAMAENVEIPTTLKQTITYELIQE